MGRNPEDRVCEQWALKWPTTLCCFVLFLHCSWLPKKYILGIRNQNKTINHRHFFKYIFYWGADLCTDQPRLLVSMCITFKSCLPAATLAPPTSPRHTLLISVWHRWRSYRQLMCERVRPMPVALSHCSPCGPFALHFCQMCNIYLLLSRLWFCSEAYMTLVDMQLVILSSLVRRGWQTNSCRAGTLKTQL